MPSFKLSKPKFPMLSFYCKAMTWRHSHCEFHRLSGFRLENRKEKTKSNERQTIRAISWKEVTGSYVGKLLGKRFGQTWDSKGTRTRFQPERRQFGVRNSELRKELIRNERKWKANLAVVYCWKIQDWRMEFLKGFSLNRVSIRDSLMPLD